MTHALCSPDVSVKFSRALRLLDNLDAYADSIPAFIKAEVAFKVASHVTEGDLRSVGLQVGKMPATSVRLDRVVAYLKLR